MVTLFIRHSVASFAAWSQAFDEFAPAFEALEVKAHAVYQGVANPDDITVVLDFDRLEAAEVFLIRQELKTAMEKGGAGAPTIWFTSRL